MKLRSVMTVLALGACAPSFAADPVTVILEKFKYGGNEQARITNDGFAIGNGASYRAGEYLGSINGQSFSTFCTDVYESLSFGPTYQYDRKTVDQTKQLWGGDLYNPNSYSLVSKLFTTAYSSVKDSTTSAAFQYALWELLYEKTSSTYQIGAYGNFWLTDTNAAAAAQADTWLSSLANAAEGYSVQSLYSGANQNPANNKQDLVIATPVPEPQTYALALVSLSIVAGYARRKRDKA